MNKQQIEEARQLLDGYLIQEEVSNLQTYQLFHDIYEKNLLPIKNNICFSSALIVILCHLSRPLNWFKFNIYLHQEANKPHIPMNVYGMNILKSGGGKGLTTNTMNALLSFKNIQNEYIDQIDVEDADESKGKLKVIAGAEIQDSATTAGLRSINKILNDCFKDLDIQNTFGSVFFNLEEFADTLENATNFDKDFLSTLKNLYDLGNTGAKAVSEQIKEAIEEFGVSFLASTTEKTLQENPRVSRAFNNYLISGNARRSLFSMPCEKEVEELENKTQQNQFTSLREWHEQTRYKEDGKIDELKKRIYATLKKFVEMKNRRETNIFVDSETYFYYRVYKAYCNQLKDDINNEILKVEMESRAWKALKISGILTLYCSVSDSVISPEYFLNAIKIVEFYGHHLKRYLNNRVSGCADKIVELLLDTDCALSQAELSHNNEILSYNSKNETPVKFLKQQMEDVEQILNSRGYDLICQKTGYRNKVIVYAAIKSELGSNFCIDNKPPYRIFNNIPKMSAVDEKFESLKEQKDILDRCFEKSGKN